MEELSQKIDRTVKKFIWRKIRKEGSGQKVCACTYLSSKQLMLPLPSFFSLLCLFFTFFLLCFYPYSHFYRYDSPLFHLICPSWTQNSPNNFQPKHQSTDFKFQHGIERFQRFWTRLIERLSQGCQRGASKTTIGQHHPLLPLTQTKTFSADQKDGLAYKKVPGQDNCDQLGCPEQPTIFFQSIQTPSKIVGCPLPPPLSALHTLHLPLVT